MFLDPFYSPGSDFIAIGNGYITELTARDFAGRMDTPTVRHFQPLLLSFYRNTLSLYRGQYPLFGHARVMTAKVRRDYACYWGVLAPLAIGDHTTDLALFTDLSAEMATAEALNLRMQALFRDWHAQGTSHSPPDWMDQYELAWFVQLNAQLHGRLDATGIRERLLEYVELLCAALATDATRDAPELAIKSLCTAAGQRARPALFGAAA